MRTSKVCFLSDEWIYDIIHPLIAEANKRTTWNFEYTHTEPMQFTQYGLNEFYDWHQDSTPFPLKMFTQILKVKLESLALLLTYQNQVIMKEEI